MDNGGRPVESSFKPSAVDGSCRAYLQKVRESRGEGFPGVYVHEGSGSTTMRAVFTVFLLGAGVIMFIPGWQFHIHVQTTTLALGTLMFVFTLRRWSLERGPHFLGDFRFIDGAYCWSVQTHRVDVLRLGRAREVVEQTVNRNHRFSHIELLFSFENGERKSVVITDQASGNRAAQFAHSAISVWSQAAGDVRTEFTRKPEMLAALTAQSIAGAPLENAALGPPIPNVPVAQSGEGPMSAKWGWAFLVLSFVAWYFATPRIHTFISDAMNG